MEFHEDSEVAVQLNDLPPLFDVACYVVDYWVLQEIGPGSPFGNLGC